jgi:acylglycerol lipase
MVRKALLLLPWFVLGCVSTPYLPARTALMDMVPPPDVQYRNDQFLSGSNVQIAVQRWAPMHKTRGAVVLVHGLKDHSSRYRDLVTSLVHHGYSVHAFDLPGHGYSEGFRDHISSAESCLGDLDRVVARARDWAPDRPVFIVGQGFGASLAALYAVRHKEGIAGLVLSAPSLRINVSGGERFGLTMADFFEPRAPRKTIDWNGWAADPDVTREVRNDPLVTPGQPTARTTRQLLVTSDELQKGFGQVKVPLLIIDGDKDTVSDRASMEALARNAQSPDKTVTIYPGLGYDLFHERDREQVMSDLVDWLQKRSEVATPPGARASK